MNPRYRWLLFDADGTLFDFERAETSALTRTFAQFDLPLAPDLQDTYRKIKLGEGPRQRARLRPLEIKQRAVRVEQQPAIAWVHAADLT